MLLLVRLRLTNIQSAQEGAHSILNEIPWKYGLEFVKKLGTQKQKEKKVTSMEQGQCVGQTPKLE